MFKCDLRVPRCSTCHKQNEQCNITDRVTYTYAAVQSLQDRIIELQAKLDAVSEATASQTGPISEPGQFNDVRKEAEEIGVLAIGRPSGYSERIYSKCGSFTPWIGDAIQNDID